MVGNYSYSSPIGDYYEGSESFREPLAIDENSDPLCNFSTFLTELLIEPYKDPPRPSLLISNVILLEVA